MKKPVMPPAFWQELADHSPTGIRVSAADVQNWFDFVWLRYSTYGYRNHKRAIIQWWSRVRDSEVESALQRADRIVNDDENAAIEAQVSKLPFAYHAPRDHFAKLRHAG